MKVGVLGTGMVGLAISNRPAELEYEVMIGTREPSKSGDKMKSKNEAVKVGRFTEAAVFGQVVFNVTNGAGSLEALNLAGESNLDSKVLVDISNPLDFSKGMPPTLPVSNTDSLGEQIQRAFPQQTANGDHHVFVSGNDVKAKEQVVEILKSFGWIHILDLGDITTTRGTEMYLPIWLRL